ncbi:MAG: TMEM175 family protein [Rudaea sp.]
MEKGRLAAFTDGVIAVIITIMVLELKPPHEATFAALLEHWPIFLSYVLSFVYVGIYWNNHHHLLHAVEHVNGKVMWANLFFLFWLSLFPFTTTWLNESWLGDARPALEHLPAMPWVPTALYGVVLLMTALSWIPLSRSLIACNGGSEGDLAQALGGEWGNWKTLVSPIIYLAAIVLAYFVPIVSCGLYAVVAAIWFIPDRRIENKVIENKVSSP